MADLTIDGAIEKLLQLPEKIGRAGAEIMRDEVPNKTGALAASVTYEVSGDTIFIYTDKPYAKYVEYGRGEVRPVRAKALHWDDVFAMYSSPTKPNDFVGRTKQRLESMTFTL